MLELLVGGGEGRDGVEIMEAATSANCWSKLLPWCPTAAPSNTRRVAADRLLSCAGQAAAPAWLPPCGAAGAAGGAAGLGWAAR